MLAAQPAGAKPRVMIALVPQEPLPKFPLLFDFEDRGFAVGLTSPTLGGYSKRQMLLDIGQGARISTRVYDPRAIPDTQLVEEPPGGRMTNWDEIAKRAEDAPGEVEPGLLATTVNEHGGRSAYAGILGFEQLDAIPAAGPDRAASTSFPLGTQGTLVDRARELWEQADFVVARLPGDELGIEALEELIAARRPDDMVYAMRAPPPGGLQLLPDRRARPAASRACSHSPTTPPRRARRRARTSRRRCSTTSASTCPTRCRAGSSRADPTARRATCSDLGARLGRGLEPARPGAAVAARLLRWLASRSACACATATAPASRSVRARSPSCGCLPSRC